MVIKQQRIYFRFGDIVPENHWQRMYAAGVMVSGILLLHEMLLGSIALMLINSDRSRTNYVNKVDTIKKHMVSPKVIIGLLGKNLMAIEYIGIHVATLFDVKIPFHRSMLYLAIRSEKYEEIANGSAMQWRFDFYNKP